MDIKTFVQVISNLPPDIAVLAKGPTGIGKSHIVHQVGKRLNMEVVDRRLSYMTEGDLIGLPELVDGTTRFAPVDWFIRACNEPLILFFDELNRATIEVQQCAFQIVLDRELNGHKLHPETRVYAAINEGSDYQVSDMDPALLRRFWSIGLEPTTNDWLDWAGTTGNIDPIIVEFITKYPAKLRHEGQFEPGKVYPNPASWARLDAAFKHANITPSETIETNESSIRDLQYSMSLGFIGAETTIAFNEFIRKYKSNFGALDVFDRYTPGSSTKSKIDKLSTDKKNDLLGLIARYSKDNDIAITQIERACNFVCACSEEMLVNFMNMVMENKNLENIKKFHKFLGDKFVNAVNGANGTKV